MYCAAGVEGIGTQFLTISSYWEQIMKIMPFRKCVLTERPKPGEKVKEKIVCETCGKEVTCKSQLKIHMMKHTGETPFKCQVPGCGKGFPTKNNLKK